MEEENMHFRHVLLFYFRKGKTARQACEKLRKVYGDKSLKQRQCQRWFKKFNEGDFDLNDAPRSGRPSEIDDDKIIALVDSNPHYTTRDMAEILKIANSSVQVHLKKLEYVSRLDVWIPHELNEVQFKARKKICDMLIKREGNNPFLNRLITGDEKWIAYNNIMRKRSWSRSHDSPQTTSKPDIHQMKIMISVWWDCKGVVYFEFLPRNRTINSIVYCRQLDSLNEAIIQKRPELVDPKRVVLHHDNAKPHTSLMTREKISQLGWEVLPHPSYSPDLAPSDFHLFLSLQNSMRAMRFNSDEDLKQHIVQFFANKDKSFYERGILKLTERWKKVIEQNGAYIID